MSKHEDIDDSGNQNSYLFRRNEQIHKFRNDDIFKKMN